MSIVLTIMIRKLKNDILKFPQLDYRLALLRKSSMIMDCCGFTNVMVPRGLLSVNDANQFWILPLGRCVPQLQGARLEKACCGNVYCLMFSPE